MTSDKLNLPILYQDDELLVIDKPFGVVVNRAKTVKEATVQDWMDSKFKIQNSKFKNINSDFIDRSGVVHRLDKETSGCLVLAKTEPAFIRLQQAFKSRQVKKEYLALVHGKLVPQEGEIRAPVARLPWNKERFGIVPGGKEAVTKYHVFLRPGSGQASVMRQEIDRQKYEYSLIKLFPETGRTHQLRVHLKYLGFPIVGDYLYAGRKLSRQDRTWCPRMFLHATKITFAHPVTGQNLSVEAPLPKELSQVLSKLQI